MIRTELEYCALGVIWRRGTCSTYEVRNEFAKSPSAYWSASAGSVYPVVERLLAAGLVSAQECAVGHRKSRILAVTEEGLAALRHWVSAMDRASTTATYDPVRTKFTFLDALPRARERKAALDRAISESKLRLKELAQEEIHAKDRGDRFGRLAVRGARYEIEARLGWLQEVAGQLVDGEEKAGLAAGASPG